jgi:hypothetical protein
MDRLCSVLVPHSIVKSKLVSGFLSRHCFLTLPAKFARLATPDRQLQRHLECPPTRAGCSEAVVYLAHYYVAASTFWTMIIWHVVSPRQVIWDLQTRLYLSNPYATEIYFDNHFKSNGYRSLTAGPGNCRDQFWCAHANTHRNAASSATGFNAGGPAQAVISP